MAPTSGGWRSGVSGKTFGVEGIVRLLQWRIISRSSEKLAHRLTENNYGRSIALVYGGLVYFFFLITFLYTIGFLADFPDLKTIGSGGSDGLAMAVIVDLRCSVCSRCNTA